MIYLVCFLFIVGFILLGIEMFIPGFGVPGVMGILSIICAMVFTIKFFTYGIFIVVAIAILFTVMISIFLRWIMKKQMYGSLILQDICKYEESEIGDLDYFLGKEGSTITSLRPQGSVDFNGVRLDVFSYGPYIAEGKSVKVIEVNQQKIIVKEIKYENA